MHIQKNTQPITDLALWEKLAGPKSKGQWKEGRSAMEVARAWLACTMPEFPQEIRDALASHPDFGTVLRWHAEPEAKVTFDANGGEPRNCDLLVTAEDERGSFVLSIEAKADEPFGDTVAATRAAAANRLQENPASRGIARIEGLREMLFRHGIPDERFDGLRYQLLTATAGALAAARAAGSNRAVMLVHEFTGSSTRREKLARNGADLDAFVEVISGGEIAGCPSGKVVGPVSVPGSGATLYIGKATRAIA